MEEVDQRGNAKADLKLVRQKKGSPGIDGMNADLHVRRYRKGVAGIPSYTKSRSWMAGDYFSPATLATSAA